MNIKIGTEFAPCESCGNVTKIDPMDAKRFTRAYGAARLSMGLNSVAGYEAALRELDTISFIEEARKTRADCEKRLRDLQADLQRRQTPQRQDTSFAGVLLALTLVFCAAAFTGIAYLAFRLIQGTLSPTATALVITLAALAVVFAFLNKLKKPNR